MKKLSVYYLIHIIINILMLIFFSEFVNIHLLSVLPIFLFCLMIFQITLFKRDNQRTTIGDTSYSVGNTVRLTDEELDYQNSYLRLSFLLCLPFEIPLIFFLSSYLKLLSVIPYIIAYIIGGIVFKVKFKKKIQSRIEAEKKELEEQKKREELGVL